MLLKQSVDVDRLGLVDQPFHLDGPRPRIEVLGQVRWFVFIGAEFVIIVVVGYVFQRSLCFRCAEGTLAVIELGARQDRLRGREDPAEFVVSKGASSQSPSAGDEAPAI